MYHFLVPKRPSDIPKSFAKAPSILSVSPVYTELLLGTCVLGLNLTPLLIHLSLSQKTREQLGFSKTEPPCIRV